jgi:hypothetical protein
LRLASQDDELTRGSTSSTTVAASGARVDRLLEFRFVHLAQFVVEETTALITNERAFAFSLAGSGKQATATHTITRLSRLLRLLLGRRAANLFRNGGGETTPEAASSPVQR